MTAWCILRTAGRSTARLVKSLTEDGFDVWTPMETRAIPNPRAKGKRKVRTPIIPSYVFARAEHLADLLELAQTPLQPRDGRRVHVAFRVVHGVTTIPIIADHHFAELRAIERIRTPIERPEKPGLVRAERPMPVGAAVQVDGGSFGGMQGTVERSDCGYTVVSFGGWRVTIPTSNLRLDAVCGHREDAA
jgi:transcription antitermination factor NusG